MTLASSIRPIDLDQIDRLLNLNNFHAQELSWLDEARLKKILRVAFAAWRLGNIDAFIIALDQSADYDGENFLWFKSRYEKFVYVDRIVVAATARGRGYAKLLYHDLFAAASHCGHTSVVCEVNADPPNPESDAFHQSMGFEQVGAATLRSGKKTVNYLLLNLNNRRFSDFLASNRLGEADLTPPNGVLLSAAGGLRRWELRRPAKRREAG